MSDSTETATEPPRLSKARLRGRRVAQLLYYALVTGIAVAALVQVTRQVFFEEPRSEPAPFSSCEQGLQYLYQAIQRGRTAAERSQPDEDEEAALLRYREAVGPSWQYRDDVLELCGSSAEARRLLDALERLRYSEEHGVRHQATELTALRQRVRRLMAQRAREPSGSPR